MEGNNYELEIQNDEMKWCILHKDWGQIIVIVQLKSQNYEIRKYEIKWQQLTHHLDNFVTHNYVLLWGNRFNHILPLTGGNGLPYEGSYQGHKWVMRAWDRSQSAVGRCAAQHYFNKISQLLFNAAPSTTWPQCWQKPGYSSSLWLANSN